MFNKPINTILKPQFERIYADAVEEAEQDFKIKILNKVENLEHFDEFKCLVSEKNRIEDLIEKNNHPYYINNHQAKDWLLTQLSNRHFLLNIDEFEEFKEAVYLGAINYLIDERVSDLRMQIPKLTFDDFLLGKECRYLNTFDIHYNIEKEDFYKIASWKSERLIKIVSYEVKLLVENHQKYCTKINDPLDFIELQIQIFEEELKEPINDAKEIKRTLSKLYAFEGFDIDNFNDELLLANYPVLFTENIEYKGLSQAILSKAFTKLSSESKMFFSNEYIVFYTLVAFLSWLKSIVKGKPIQKQFKFPDWENVLIQKFEESEQEFQSIIEVMDDFAYSPTKSKKEIRNYLRNEFEKQIDKYNKIERKRVFYFLSAENRNSLISEFQISVLFNGEEEEYLNKIKEAYILQNVSWYLYQNFNNIFDTNTIYFKHSLGSHLAILKLTNDMVLDKELSIELEEAKDSFYNELNSTLLPIDLHFYNHREKYSRIFEKSISRLQDVLDNAEPNKKVLYIQSRLKELRHRELKFRMEVGGKKDLKNKGDKYPNLFKEFLSIEAEFIKETIQISPNTFLPNQAQSLLLEEETEAFKTFLGQENQDYVLGLLEDLSITVDGKSVLSSRKKGALRGVVEALREENILPQIGIDKLCKIIAKEIDLELKSKLDFSDISQKFQKDAKQYIKDNPLH